MKKVDEGHHVQAEELLSQSLYLQHFPSSLQNDPEKQHTCVCVCIYNVRTHTQIYIYVQMHTCMNIKQYQLLRSN